MSAVARHNVVVSGAPDGQPMVFAHGFGCDQNMWRHVAPAFADDFRIVLFDYVGCGSSHHSAFDTEKYSRLEGYADDVVDLLRELDLRDVVFVGHSVSSMIGVLAQRIEPERFAKLVLVGPSPRYIDTDDYRGGFSEADIDELLEALESNYLGWSAAMAPVIVGNPDQPELGDELTASFCRTDPAVARRFARTTFLSDTRAELADVSVPTLVLQCSADVIAPLEVGQFVSDAIPDSELVVMRATGHCPNLSAPGETIAAISSFARPTAV